MSSQNLAARAGAWSADNWKKALFGWLVFAVVGDGGRQPRRPRPDEGLGLRLRRGRRPRSRCSTQAGMTQPASESVLIQSQDADGRSDPLFLATAGLVVQTLSLQPDAVDLQNPLIKQSGGGQISADGHSMLVQFNVRGDPNTAKDRIKPILDAIAERPGREPRLQRPRGRHRRARTTRSATRSTRTSRTPSG